MSELTQRPYQVDDAAVVADLFNAIEVAFGADTGYTEPETRAIMSVHADSWAENTRLVFAPTGELVAAGFVNPPPPGGDKASLHGGVRPAWRGRGIGRELLAWQLDRLDKMQHDAGAPWIAECDAPQLDTQAAAMFARFGITPVRYFTAMYAPVGATEVRARPDGIRITSYQPELGRTLHLAHMEAFADHWGYQRRPYEQWAAYSIESETFRPDLSRIAFDRDEIAAYVLAYDGAEGKLYIGQVGTRRPWRRRGLASLLIAEVLAAGAAAGRSKAELGVDTANPTGALGVYERLGFRAHTVFVAYHRV